MSVKNIASKINEVINLFSNLVRNKTDSKGFFLKTGDPTGEIKNIPNSLHLGQYEDITKDISSMITTREQETLLLLSIFGNTQGNIVEIGSWVGKSTSLLAKGCSIRNEGIVYAIDHFKGRPGKEDLYYRGLSKNETIFDRFTKNIKEIGLEAYIKVFKMYSQEARGKINDNIRLLFIDGDHEYESVYRDIKLFEGLVNSGGIIAIHDYSIAFPGVIKAVKEGITDTGRFERFILVDSLFIAHKR